MTEAHLLMRFRTLYQRGEDRLSLLRRYADAQVSRPADWDYAKVRADVRTPDAPLECWCCHHRSRVVQWHHIIQVQHGGSNHALNFVGICNLCHARVHPWMPGEPIIKAWWYIGAQQVTRKTDER